MAMCMMLMATMILGGSFSVHAASVSVKQPGSVVASGGGRSNVRQLGASTTLFSNANLADDYLIVSSDFYVEDKGTESGNNAVLFFEGRSNAGWFLNKEQFAIMPSGDISCIAEGVYPSQGKYSMGKWYHFELKFDYSDDTFYNTVTDLSDNSVVARFGKLHNVNSDTTQIAQIAIKSQTGTIYLDNFSVTTQPKLKVTAPAANATVGYTDGVLNGTASAKAPSDFTKLSFALNGTEFAAVTSASSDDIYTADLSNATNVKKGTLNELTVTAEYADRAAETVSSSFYAVAKTVSEDVIVSADFNGRSSWDYSTDVTGYYMTGAYTPSGVVTSSYFYDRQDGKGMTVVTRSDGTDYAIQMPSSKSLTSEPAINMNFDSTKLPAYFVMEMDTKISEKAKVQLNYIAPSTHGWDPAAHLFAANGMVMNGTIPYTVGEWKKVKLEFDYTASTIKIYYDNKLASTIAATTKMARCELALDRADFNFSIDNIKIYVPQESTAPYVTAIGYSNTAGGEVFDATAASPLIPTTAKSVTLTTSEALTISADDIKITKPGNRGTPQRVSGTAVISGNTVTIPLNEDLSAETTYTVTVGDVAQTTFVPYVPKNEISVSGSTATYQLYSDSKMTVELIIAGYNGNKLEKVVVSPAVSVEAGKQFETSLSLPDGTYTAVKAMCWDSLSSLKPVLAAN